MHALNSVVPLSATSNRLVSNIADLAEIFEPGVQVCCWQRSIDVQIADYLANKVPTGTLKLMEKLQPDQSAQLTGLPAADGYEQLRDDVSLLAEILFELLDCSNIGLRSTQVEHAMCPRWHVDRVALRLLCTYEGPSTEWLDDQTIVREKLRSPDVDGADCQRAATFDVVLLKGALWQDNEGFGAIHRSPDITENAGRRTLITMDPLWNT